MKTLVKMVVNLSSIALLTIFSFNSVVAQNDEKGSMDHPLIARIPNSTILVYDLKQFNEYLLPLGKMTNDTLSRKQKLEGKITQITYAAPVDKSVLEIVRNYEILLKNEGFAILFSGKKDELGNKWIDEYVKATSRPYRYGAPGLNTRLDGDFSYLAAKKTRAEGDVYVALCVNQGWFQKFPIIQLDVIETIPMQTGMMKTNANTEQTDLQKSNAPMVAPLSPNTIGNKSWEIEIGAGAFAFSDPSLAGSSNNFRNNLTGTITGSLTGFRLLAGPYLNIKYFLSENFGFSFDINYLSNKEYIYTSALRYANNADLFAQKIGIVGQVVGKSTPIHLSATLGIGHCLTELTQQTTIVPPNTGTDLYLKGKASMVVYFFKVEAAYPIYKKLFLFGNYEFNLTPVGSFVMEHDGGNDYSDTWYSMNFGGSHFRVGLGYSF
ncbi:MAG TPA: hypothetical protein VMV56_00725 [Williamwhitmania sp.]|nr:hypothetical protein [Williamwhitmania sp.]